MKSSLGLSVSYLCVSTSKVRSFRKWAVCLPNTLKVINWITIQQPTRIFGRCSIIRRIRTSCQSLLSRRPTLNCGDIVRGKKINRRGVSSLLQQSKETTNSLWTRDTRSTARSYCNLLATTQKKKISSSFSRRTTKRSLIISSPKRVLPFLKSYIRILPKTSNYTTLNIHHSWKMKSPNSSISQARYPKSNHSLTNLGMIPI